MCLKQTQHILDATRETVDQGLSLQRSIVEKFKKRVLDEPYASCEPPKRRTKVANSDIITEPHPESNEDTDITEDSDIIAESHSESNEETDTEVINITEDNAEIKGLIQVFSIRYLLHTIIILTHTLISRMRGIFATNYLKFWTQSKTKKENLKRTICHRYT